MLVYVSAWLKCHYPEVFAAALLNSQPMGFYAPAQIVRDAREHEVEVRPADVNASDWDCTLEPAAGGRFALRLGLRQIKGLAEARGAGADGGPGPTAMPRWPPSGAAPGSPPRPWRRWPGPTPSAPSASPAATRSGRSRAWRSAGRASGRCRFSPRRGEEERGPEPQVQLPKAALSEEVVDDYMSLRLSLKAHPVSFLREGLARDGMVEAKRLTELRDGAWLKLAGLVLVRQRPGSAKGVIFATLEDETGVANIVVWPDCFQRHRQVVLKASLLAVEGRLQVEGAVIHLIAPAPDRLEPPPRGAGGAGACPG